MFHNGDESQTEPLRERREWISLLARAPIELLESTMADHARATPHWLRAPETGLMMVQGRVGGTGERFNLGEVSVTRCTLRVGEKSSAKAKIGVAYVMGRSHRHAQLAALADALLQTESEASVLRQTLLAPAREHLARVRAERYARAQSTKVEFFTVAREASGATDDADDE